MTISSARIEGRVLVVDDQKTNRMKMEFAVRNLGFDVETVASGTECLDTLKKQPFDIVLLDIVMPGIDGFEVLRIIKGDPTMRDIPVIVISSLEEMQDSVRAIELGADDFLTKPFNPVLLKARLGAGIERKRLRDKELEYLQQVDRLAAASGVIEQKDFDPSRLGLDDISQRDDQLGNLARVFLGMASEVYRREQNLRNQISLLKGGFLLLLLGACWGLVPSVSRIIMVDGLHPLGAVFWTLWISAGLMLAVSIVTGRHPGTSWPEIRRYMLLGLFGNALAQLFLLWAASEVSAMIISIILAAESFMVFIVAASLGFEAPSLKRFFGLCLGLACVVLIMVPGNEAGGVGGWVWMLIALLVPFCYAIEDIIVAAIPGGECDPIAVATGTIIAAACLMTPLTVLSGSFIPPEIALGDYGWALFLIAAISSFCSILLVYTIRTTGAVFASQAGYSMTAAGIFWSVLLLGESMSVWVWAALACLVSGLALVMPKQVEETAEARTVGQPSAT